MGNLCFAGIFISFSRKEVNKAAVRRLLHRWIPQSSIGLEFTDYSIKLVEICPDGSDGFRLLRTHIEPLPRGTIDDGRITNPVKVIQALQHAIKLNGFKSKKVHFVLPSHLIMVRFIKLPDIPDHDLQKVVDFEVKHNIHLPFEQPIYDFVKLNGTYNHRKLIKQRPAKKDVDEEIATPDDWTRQEAAAAFGGSNITSLFGEEERKEASGESPAVCDVMLTAAPQELVLQYMEMIQSAGLSPAGIDVKALALFRFIERTECVHPDGTMLVVDVNQKYTDLSIFHDKQLKITRSVPLSFEIAKSEATAKEPDTFHFFEEFETAGDSQFQNTCGDLVHELERLMNFYRYTLNNRNQEFDTLALSGDAERLPEIADALRSRLDAEIVVMSTDKVRALDDEPISGLPVFAVPIGLGMRGRSE
jgi:type IV pilus assembly protein PilM